VIAAVAVGVIAFLLLRGNDDDNNVATATDRSDQSSDKTDSKSSSSKPSSTSAEFVDPVGVEDRLLTASDVGSEFTDETFTPSTQTTDLCGNPNARSVVPSTKDVGSAASEASRNLYFEQEVAFHKNAADNRKAFDVGLNSLRSCTEGTLSDSGSTQSFTISNPEDVSSDVGVSQAVQAEVQAGDVTVITVGVRLDNCIVLFTYQFPTSDGESARPDATGIAKDGIDRLLS
jgi:hypothetical protein